MSRAVKMRLDQLLVERGLAETRTRAQAIIMAGKVRSGSERLTKAGVRVDPGLPIEVEQPPRFVSRAGEKLEGFLTTLNLPITGGYFLDVGASTGGFTDCLLQRGAAAVVCVDVGRGQLHHRLQTDPRVTSLEKVNARFLSETTLPLADYDGVVMDLSFISLRAVLEPVWARVRPGGFLIALVKPQFEARKEEVDAGRGIITDPAIRQRVLTEIRTFAAEHLPQANEIGWAESSLPGTDGNCEYLLALRREQTD